MSAVIALVPNLMDRSKILAATADEVRFVPAAQDLPGAAASPGVRVVVVDLSSPGILDVLPLLAATGVRVVGFGSHVDRQGLLEASRAGCSQVLARSAFFGRLAGVLAGGDAPL